MAVHKVPQDVEADDKFLGPLSFKQFVFGGGAAVTGYVTFLLLVRGLWPIAAIFFLPFIALAVLAFPWSREQPTELWLAARIRFLIKPRKRIWDQSGAKDLVHITAPIRQARHYSDGLSQKEVRSRLSALATMIDSRGWAVKNYNPATAVQDEVEESDRLVAGNIDNMNPASATGEGQQADMLEDGGIIAKQFDTMIARSEQAHKSQAQNIVAQARRQAAEQPNQSSSASTQSRDADFWFMHQQSAPTDPSLSTFGASPVIHPGASDDSNTATTQPQLSAADEQALLEHAHEKHRQDALQTTSRHEKRLDPHAAYAQPSKTEEKPQQSAPNPDILNLSRNNDLSVETIARQAKKDDDDNEVVISLH